MDIITVKEFNKRYNKAVKHSAVLLVSNFCVLLVSFALYLVTDFNQLYLFLGGSFILLRLIFKKLIATLYRKVDYVLINKTFITLEFLHFSKRYHFELKRSDVKIQLRTRKSYHNALIGFDLILIDTDQKRYFISDLIFDLIELEDIYLSLHSDTNSLDEKENKEALKQIQFQTLVEKKTRYSNGKNHNQRT